VWPVFILERYFASNSFSAVRKALSSARFDTAVPKKATTPTGNKTFGRRNCGCLSSRRWRTFSSSSLKLFCRLFVTKLWTKQQLVVLKMAVLWVVAPCSLVGVYQSLKGTCCLHHQCDGGSKHFRNVGKFLTEYAAPRPSSQPSLCSPPWEPQIHLVLLLAVTRARHKRHCS
jgi:hypothetical protein